MQVLHIWGSADELAGMAALGFKQDGHDFANACLIEFVLIIKKLVLQNFKASFFDFFWNLVGHYSGRCSGARAVFERIFLEFGWSL